MSKRVLAAAIVRDYEFDKPWDCYNFLRSLDVRRIDYLLLEKARMEDGRVLLRIMTKYNCNELIELYDNQRSLFHDQQYAYCRIHSNSDGFIECKKCRWRYVCPLTGDDAQWTELEYCERFDALVEVSGNE